MFSLPLSSLIFITVPSLAMFDSDPVSAPIMPLIYETAALADVVIVVIAVAVAVAVC